MTDQEITKEWGYICQERLGIMCGANEPTPEQVRIARKEADEAAEKLRNEILLVQN